MKRTGVYNNSNALEPGGLSGKPLQETSTKLIADFYKLTNGKLNLYKYLFAINTFNNI